MKITLINPPSPFLLDDRVFPPLGLLQVGAALEAAGEDVRLIDLAGSPDWEYELAAEKPADLYAITATTPQFPAAVQIARILREVAPASRLVIGGPHATVMPESCVAFDTVVMGDGEEAAISAIRRDAPRLLDHTNVEGGPLRWHRPMRQLLDMDSYRYSLDGLPATSMMLSQGCPYNCSFCCGRLTPYYRRVRVRPLDDVLSEIGELVESYAARGLMLFDDEVNLVDSALLAFCGAVKPFGLKLRAFVKANLFTDAQAEAMAAAGFVEVCTGVESGDDGILKTIEKKTTRAINTRFVALANKHGIRAKAFCSLGHPGETWESARETESWLLEARPDDFDVTLITIYPGTPIWAGKVLDGEGDYSYTAKTGASLHFSAIDYSVEFAYYKGRPREYVSHVWTETLSREDLVALRDGIEERVRASLGIAYPKAFSGDQYEHSMGQGLG